MKAKTRLLVGLIALSVFSVVGVTAVMFANNGGFVPAARAAETGENEATIANCRYGAAPADDQSVSTISKLGAGWYLTFNPNPPSTPPGNGAEFARMVKLSQKKDGDTYLQDYNIQPALGPKFANSIRNKPGQIYIIGNEVDRIGQGEMFPDMYARAYHDAYTFIKRNDPTAQVAISGLVQVTPNRLQYLDLVWQSYIKAYGNTMPVDIWTMHLYVLPELMPDGITPNGIASIALGTDPSLGKRESGGDPAQCSQADVYCYAEHDDLGIFAQQVTAMRQWMKDHGQQNKPLLLSEFSILYPYEIDQDGCFLQDEFGNCFTPARIKSFMSKTFDYMKNARDPNLGYPLDNNRLLQRSMWFSVYYDQEGASSNLALADRSTLTEVGQNFVNRVQAENRLRNLIVEPVRPISAALDGGSTATALLQATFRNNGNETITKPFEVSFYSDPLLTKLIGSVSVQSSVSGCATLPTTVSLPWPGLGKGTHKFWVFVDSEADISEVPAGNEDNIAQGSVTVYANQLRLPVVRGE